MHKLKDLMTAVFSNKLQTLALLLFATSVFFFTLFLIFLYLNAILSVHVIMTLALSLSLLATWLVYITIRNPHTKDPSTVSSVLIVAGGFTIGVLGTFLSGYLIMRFWPSSLGPLPALFFSTVPCMGLGSLLGLISGNIIYEYDKRYVGMLYLYIIIGAILFGAAGLLTGLYPTIQSNDYPTADLLLTTPCGIILGIYIGWRLWRSRYLTRSNK